MSFLDDFAFPFNIKDPIFINSDTFKPYRSFRYKYFNHRMADILPAVETRGPTYSSDTNVDLDVNFQEIVSIFDTGELRDNARFVQYVNEPCVSFNNSDLDGWIREGLKEPEQKARFWSFGKKENQAPSDAHTQRERCAFMRLFFTSMQNVFRMATVAISSLETLKAIHASGGEVALRTACNKVVNDNSEGLFDLIDENERMDLSRWLYDASIQYIAGFTLGLKTVGGLFANDLGLDEKNEKTSDNLTELTDEEFADLTSYGRGAWYEERCREVLEEAGYSVRKTPPSGDQGADLICEKEGLSFAVQCKNMARVGNKAVQEVLASMRYYGTDFGVVVIPGEFTRAALELAAANRVILITTDKLADIYYIGR